jgi:serine/threonine-protein kinase
MKPSQAVVRVVPDGPTTAYRGPTPGGAAAPASRCRVAGSWAEGSGYHAEVAALLLRRLRVVTLIALLPSLLFQLRNLIALPWPLTPYQRGDLLVHLAANVLMAGLAVLVWSRPTFCLRALRALELTLFGSLAAFFGWLQYCVLCHDLPAPLADVRDLPIVFRLAVVASAVRWFFLIVIYGVFIPNTWRRCALLVSAVALVPLVITPLGAALHDQFVPGLGDALVTLGILMGTGVAVAVFGAYRLQVLQRQAFEAQQLGQYRLERRLGSGGMGEVYLGEHVLLRRPCAVKLIRPEKAGDPTTLQRFEREVQAMATLTHPNTVEVYDYGHADDGTFYYVMEYLPGQNLEALVARHGPLPAARAIHFLRQVCGALREAHGIGLLHRDIKPSNILACERGGVFDVAKLLDFGLVQDMGPGKAANRLTVQGTVLGSPPFMAPEQAAGRTDLDARADIYSVGGVGYFLLTGRPPFERDTAMEMLLAHAYEPVVPPRELRPEVPADLEAVLLRCLHKKPEERYPSAEALGKALAACQDAGDWTEEKAGAWWQGVGEQEETEQHAAVGAVTPAERAV